MSMPNHRLGLRIIVTGLLCEILAVWPLPEARASSDVEVQFDLHKTNAELYEQVKALKSDLALPGTCDNAALSVAKQALFFWEIQTHSRSVMKETAGAIREGADSVGADNAGKVAELAGEVIAAYDTEDPEGALGQAIVNNAMDWATEKAKGKLPASLKKEAEKAGNAARDKINKALFGGPIGRRVTESVSIPGMRYCSPKVTVDFQPPSGQNKGGMYVLVEGRCDCHQKENIQKLQYFYITVYLPLEGMEAKLDWSRGQGKALMDVRDVIKSSQKLYTGVENSMKKQEGDEEKP